MSGALSVLRYAPTKIYRFECSVLAASYSPHLLR